MEIVMGKIKKPYGCYYRAANIIYLWDNTIYLANDLRKIINTIKEDCDRTYVDEEEHIYGHIVQYQTANCSPFACPINKPKWHDEFNWTILSGDGINDRGC